jgi:hypothetical protein
MENVVVPSNDMVKAYFVLPKAGTLMPQPAVLQGAVAMNMACFCPIPITWAPYFLDFKSPREALQMGRNLVATMG